MPARGFPELQQHYAAPGGKDKLAHAALLHFPHNYNYVSRTAMYHFVNKHLGLGIEEPILEKPFNRLKQRTAHRLGRQTSATARRSRFRAKIAAIAD